MILIGILPTNFLRIVLGIVSLAFVVTAQNLITVPGLGRLREGCFVETKSAMIGVGGISGILFGGTNVGVQLVAYVRSCGLSHGLFVGVVAMLFLGLNTVRIVAAGVLGLYSDLLIIIGSVGTVVPAVLGVIVGSRFRGYVSETIRRLTVLALLTIIGLRLVLTGFNVA